MLADEGDDSTGEDDTGEDDTGEDDTDVSTTSTSAPDIDHERAKALHRTLLRKSLRRERARRRRDQNIWSYVAMFGVVGWTVAVPTVLGLAFGMFVDGRVDSERSFTITFLLVGLAIGIATAWRWITDESQRRDN